MADLAAIREGLRARLATISGLRAYAAWPDVVNAPAALVRPLRWEYRQAIGNVNRLAFEIVVLAAPIQSRGIDRAQDQLDQYLTDTGALSVKAAIEGDKTLGGACTTLHVPGWRDYDGQVVNGVEFMGARIDVEVWG